MAEDVVIRLCLDYCVDGEAGCITEVCFIATGFGSYAMSSSSILNGGYFACFV